MRQFCLYLAVTTFAFAHQLLGALALAQVQHEGHALSAA